jgi:hypothetical protein
MTSTIEIDKNLFTLLLAEALLPGLVVVEIDAINFDHVRGEVSIDLRSPALPEGEVKIVYGQQQGANGAPPRRFVSSISATPYPKVEAEIRP